MLIAIPERPGWLRESALAAAPGRSLPLRQLDFALACGCTMVLAVGDAGAPEAEALRREARAAGVPLHFAADAHGLLGQLGTADELLLVAARLLPESAEAVEALASGPNVLVLPAEPGIDAGFERIDGQRAWAGAALIPGGLIERLAELPRESDAPAALLRIALQARVPERPLSEGAMEEGSWSIVPHGPAAFAPGENWRRRQLRGAQPHQATRRLAQAILGRSRALRADPRTVATFYAAAALLLAGGVALAWFGWPATGLALMAPAGLAGMIASLLARIGAGPFGRPRRSRWRPDPLLAGALDVALLAGGALAIQGAWLGRLFPPLVLLIALHMRSAAERPRALAVLSDRMVLALVLAASAALGLAQPAIMLLALAFLLGDGFDGRFKPQR